MGIDVISSKQVPQADQIDRWMSLPGAWVEAPNQRRGGESGVQRVLTEDGRTLYRKQQTGHIYRSLHHPFGYPTVMREYEALQAVAQLGIRVPTIVYVGCRKLNHVWKAVLITEALENFSSLEDCYARGDVSRWGEALHHTILFRYGKMLARLNGNGWQHGCLYLKHVFVRVEENGEVELALIDLEKTRRRCRVRQAVAHDLQQVRRRSNWTEEEWRVFLEGYQSAYGKSVQGLVG